MTPAPPPPFLPHPRPPLRCRHHTTAAAANAQAVAVGTRWVAGKKEIKRQEKNTSCGWAAGPHYHICLVAHTLRCSLCCVSSCRRGQARGVGRHPRRQMSSARTAPQAVDRLVGGAGDAVRVDQPKPGLVEHAAAAWYVGLLLPGTRLPPLVTPLKTQNRRRRPPAGRRCGRGAPWPAGRSRRPGGFAHRPACPHGSTRPCQFRQ